MAYLPFVAMRYWPSNLGAVQPSRDGKVRIFAFFLEKSIFSNAMHSGFRDFLLNMTRAVSSPSLYDAQRWFILSLKSNSVQRKTDVVMGYLLFPDHV